MTPVMAHNIRKPQRPPRHVIVARLKDAKVRQADIARKLGVSQSFVSRVIAGTATVRPTKATEAGWRMVERALGATAAGQGETA